MPDCHAENGILSSDSETDALCVLFSILYWGLMEVGLSHRLFVGGFRNVTRLMGCLKRLFAALCHDEECDDDQS